MEEEKQARRSYHSEKYHTLGRKGASGLKQQAVIQKHALRGLVNGIRALNSSGATYFSEPGAHQPH